MIDFIKLLWRNKYAYEGFLLREEIFPDLNASVKYHTGVIEYPYRSNLGHFNVGVSTNQGYLKNSIHKDYNNRVLGREQNYSDFSYFNLCESIDYLDKTVPCLSESRLTQLEFGFNIDMGDVNVTDFINNQVLMKNYKPHDVQRTFNGTGTFKQFNNYNYCIKIYDKGKQFNLSNNVLRFEIRFSSSTQFNNLEIYKLKDLKNKNRLRDLFKVLLMRFDQMMIVNNIPIEGISNNDSGKISQFKSSVYWNELSRNRSRTQISRKKKECEELFENNGVWESKKTLRTKIIEKFLRLINF